MAVESKQIGSLKFNHWRNMRRILTAALAGLTLTVGVATSASAVEGRDTNGLAKASNPDWMSKLPDSKPLTDLSIPGSHDTMTFTASGGWVKTQEVDLTQQLNSGIRALDIRLRHIGNSFTIHHGAFYLNSSFEDVLESSTDFLKAHPQETILMRVTHEYRDENVTRGFDDTFHDYMETNPQTAPMVKDHIWKPKTVNDAFPVLGAARGKIVFLQTFDDSKWPFGFKWTEDGPYMNVEDNYTETNFDRRWDYARKHIEELQKADPGKLYITHTSASGVVMPITVAAGLWPYAGVNAQAYTWLGSQGDIKKTGVVMMDFPGPDLVDKIIEFNSR